MEAGRVFPCTLLQANAFACTAETHACTQSWAQFGALLVTGTFVNTSPGLQAPGVLKTDLRRASSMQGKAAYIRPGRVGGSAALQYTDWSLINRHALAASHAAPRGAPARVLAPGIPSAP